MEEPAPQTVPEDGDRPTGAPSLRYGAATHVGNVRDNNEDTYAADTSKALWVVADGMGGLGFGEVASAISIHSVVRLVRDGHGVNQAIEIAHNRIKEYGETDAQGTNMGTTLVLLLSQGSMYNVFWVGDSRAYLFSNGKLKHITVDHSLLQELIEKGEITPEEARTDKGKNAVTRALGVQELDTVRADSVSHRWRPGEKIVLCSDGLTDFVSDPEIASILSSDADDQALSEKLIDAALTGGGRDNVTVVVVSAPDTVTGTEGDTEIPGDTTGGHTRQPDDNTGEVGDGAPESEPPAAESLNNTTRMARSPLDAAEGGSETATDAAETTNGEPETSAVDKQRRTLYIVGAILLALLAAFATLGDDEAQPQRGPAAARSDAAVDRVAAPATTPSFPDVILDRGARLAVSAHPTLGDAEYMQRRLSRAGLTAHVEKPARTADEAYQVFLGPFGDPAELEAARVELAAMGITTTRSTP